MSKKTAAVVFALVLSVIGIASAKSYSFCLGGLARVGSAELKAGDYEVKLTGTQAVITDENRGKSVTVTVTVEHKDKKYVSTQVETITKDGKDYIQAIDLEGSDARLVLSQQ